MSNTIIVPDKLSTFQWARFKLRLIARNTIVLPEYKGSAIRGAFGHVFRKVACLGGKHSTGHCMLGTRCPYHYIFETTPPADSPHGAKMSSAPHPFIIEPPLEAKRVYEQGEEIRCHVILIGKAIDFLPYFIRAFDELGAVGIGRGTYTLENVSWVDAAGVDNQIYEGRNKALTDSFSPLTLSTLSQGNAFKSMMAKNTLSLSFLTPTRIKYNGELSTDAEFHVFFRSLSRRLLLLNVFHCEGREDEDRRDLIERAHKVETIDQDLRWNDWERYSNRQKTRMRLGGFVGRVTYRGKLEEFLPYLQLGTITHVGKGATFGLGGYRLVDGSSCVGSPTT